MTDQDTTYDAPAHDAGTAKGEEKSLTEGKEAGRYETGTANSNRAAGTSTARNSTSINPDDRDPIDPQMPDMPPT